MFQPVDEAHDISLESIKALIETAQTNRYSDTQRALLAAEQAFIASQELNDKSLLLDSLKELAICSHVLTDYPNTISWAEILLREAELASATARQADGHNLIGIGHHDVGNLDIALMHFQIALGLYEEIDLKPSIATMRLNIGNIYHLKGEFETALSWLHRCMELQPTSSHIQRIRLLNTIGLTHYFLGDHADAIQFLTDSLRDAEANGFKTMQAVALENIVDVYLDYGDYAAALNFCLKALALAEQANDRKQLAGKKLQLGIIYSKMGDYAAALSQMLQALSFADDIGAVFHQINIQLHLGSIYAVLGELEKAEQSFVRSEQQAVESGYKFLEAQLCLPYSDFLITQSRQTDALELMTRGLKISEQFGARHLAHRFHLRLSAYYKTLGDVAKSARHAKLAQTVGAHFAVDDRTRNLFIELESQRFFKERAMPSKADFEDSIQLARKAIEQKHLDLANRRVRIAPPPEPHTASILVKTFGEFVVTVNGKPLTKDDWQRKKARDIFKVLLINHRKAVTTDELIELLWNGVADKNVAQVIKNSVSFIRKAIEPDLAPREPSTFLRTEGTSYILDLGDDDSIDFLQFKSLIRQAAKATTQRESLYEKAVALYAGDFLKEDLYADWAAIERESLKDAYLNALVALADAAATAGDDDAAILRAKQLLDADRAHDKGYEILLKTLSKRGDLAEARRIYAQCQDAFKKEFGATPPKHLQQIIPISS